MTDLPPIPANITELTAPVLIGTLFNWLLFGVLLVQTYIYHLNFEDDKLWQKVVVYSVFSLEVAQTVMNGVDSCFWFASGYGNLNHLGNVHISPLDAPIIGGIIAAIVQCFFAYRIFILRQSYLRICLLVVLTSMAQIIGALAIGILTFTIKEFARFHDSIVLIRCVYIWLISDAVCDILIAGTMLRLFRQSKKEGTEVKTFGKLVRLIVETNTLTAGMAIFTCTMFFAFPNQNIFTCPTLVLGKLYSNTLLVTFNNRITLRNVNRGHAYGRGAAYGLRPVVFATIDIESVRSAPNKAIDQVSTEGS